MTTGNYPQQIIETTEVRRHNGQCAYGEWLPLDDVTVPAAVREAIVDEIVEATCRDMRREPLEGGNTDDAGMVTIGGQRWVYQR